MNYDFSTPMRQSYAAILLIAYRLYKVLVRQLFPFILILFFGNKETTSSFIMYTIIVIALIGFFYSIVAFFKYYFYLEDDKLIVLKGVFKKTKLEIPFDRIQSINFEQNLIHRMFNVIKLNMDTAGSAGSELQINALDQTLATALSDHILKHRSQQAIETQTEQTKVEPKRIIFSLSIGQLMKVGITENHFRSGGLILFFVFWIWENLREIGMDVIGRMEDYAPMAKTITTSLIIMSVLFVLFMVVSFIVSLIRTVLKYFGLHMYRIGDGFIVESGLLNRREHAAKDHKIQVLSWSQNLLQKWTHIFELRLKQASSIAVNDKKSLQVAGLAWEDVLETKAYLLKDAVEELEHIELSGVNGYYRYRHMIYWTVFCVPIIAIAVYLQNFNVVVTSIAFYIYGLVSTQLSYKKKKFGISDKLVLLRGGIFGHSATMMELFKLQNIMIRRTPFQRRRGLGSLILFSASGQLTIPDISYDTCLSMKNTLLYKVESSKKSWF